MLSFRTHGKWILAGEHTVLRGGQALVFPVESRCLDFSFEPGEELTLNIQHQNTDMEMAFWGVLEKALQKLSLNRKQVAGRLTLKSNIPVGAGMGASATLCVSLAKWLSELGHLPVAEQYEFAKDLENLFHGQSSGVDVAVALRHEPLTFSTEGGFEKLSTHWKPHFYLSYCGKRGVTADCIRRVQDLMVQNAELGTKLDKQMKQAVSLACEALNTQENLPLLKEAVELAGGCFQEWGLVSRELESHMAWLKAKGAVATKPTGSGDGGFVLSLWSEPPQGSEFDETLLRAN